MSLYLVLACQYLADDSVTDVMILFCSHMDSHNLWTRTKFPAACFKIVMFSVQVGSCNKLYSCDRLLI